MESFENRHNIIKSSRLYMSGGFYIASWSQPQISPNDVTGGSTHLIGGITHLMGGSAH